MDFPTSLRPLELNCFCYSAFKFNICKWALFWLAALCCASFKNHSEVKHCLDLRHERVRLNCYELKSWRSVNVLGFVTSQKQWVENELLSFDGQCGLFDSVYRRHQTPMDGSLLPDLGSLGLWSHCLCIPNSIYCSMWFVNRLSIYLRKGNMNSWRDASGNKSSLYLSIVCPVIL